MSPTKRTLSGPNANAPADRSGPAARGGRVSAGAAWAAPDAMKLPANASPTPDIAPSPNASRRERRPGPARSFISPSPQGAALHLVGYLAPVGAGSRRIGNYLSGDDSNAGVRCADRGRSQDLI